MQSVHQDGAEPSVETMQSRQLKSYRAVVKPFIETIIRLPSILVLHVSRAFELQIGL